MVDRPMKRIPISAAKLIADQYGYDQAIVIARRIGEAPKPFGEHVTTYGVSKIHRAVAAQVGNFLKEKVMGWASENSGEHVTAELTALRAENERLRKALSKIEVIGVDEDLSNEDAIEAMYGIACAALITTSQQTKND